MSLSTRRILIVSNRLPVTARVTDGEVRLSNASGGLATGLGRTHAQSESVWIGWPGDVSRFTADQRQALDQTLRDRQIVPVHLTPEQIDRYYEQFANGVLWPVFHYLIDRVPPDASGWEAYRQVNERFAEVIAAAYRPGDLIWIHDYHLFLAPGMVRQKLPEARIGFFLHIPFPSSEVFRVLPWRREILHGLLGADLVGFHTFAYLRHFLASLLHVEGLEADVDSLQVAGRRVHTGVFPMGVDSAGFEQLAEHAAVQEQAETIRREAGGRRIVLGVDRLDYTKGIPRRLQALERLFAADPRLRDTVRYIQIAVPSRDKVESYRRFRRQIEEAVGRLNGIASTVRSTPIHYLHRSISRRDLVALYSAADVMLVTPLRDGMNLVAKEFVASRIDDDGVLVLSEFGGAAAELGEAVVVNPYDVQGIADAIAQALAMAKTERQTRMRHLRRRVREYDVHRWTSQFISRLSSTGTGRDTAALEEGAPSEPVLAALRAAPRLSLLLGYEGALVPIAPAPELAVPDPELIALLAALAARRETDVHIISGCLRATLDGWLGDLRVTLWAEHGFWRRPGPQSEWTAAAVVPTQWLQHVRPILEQFSATTPGSFIEEKTAAVAWHYRMADTEFGARQAHELRMLLGDALSNQPLEVVEGKKVVEVRLRGVSGLAAIPQRLEWSQSAPAILAIADDRAAEEMFGRLPRSSVTVAVAANRGAARFHVASHRDARDVLRSFLSD